MSDSPLSHFTRLNDLVSVYHPSTSDRKKPSNAAPQGPGLILLCSWVGAAPKHIAKYTNGYQRFFPKTSILLVQSTVLGMFTRAEISPAIDILLSFLEEPTLESGNNDSNCIMAHAFSNGGANTVIWLATAFRERYNKPLPLERMILDCCPGQPEVSVIARAITLSLPDQRSVRTLGLYIVYALMVLFMLPVWILRVEDTITRVRRSLNDSSMVARSTPRLYLYSKADDMVKYGDVHVHAEDAKRCGYENVTEEVFEKAPHCALLVEDGERYWKYVTNHVLSRNRH